MSAFNHINDSQIKGFVNAYNSCRDSIYQPALSPDSLSLLQTGNAVEKAIGYAQILIEWQNNIDEEKNDPKSSFLFDKRRFTDLKESQHKLNKLKRKFSKLFVENMPFSQQKELATEVARTLGAPDAIIPLTLYLFEHHGDDSICLKIIGQFAEHSLHAPAFLLNDRITVLGDDAYEPDPRFLFTVASTAEQFPIASNTWGYPLQESRSMTEFTESKGEAVSKRLGEQRDEEDSLLKPKNLWEKTVKMSAFKKAIKRAKYHDGSPIGNCGERGKRGFQRLCDERAFDSLTLSSIVPGDHVFTIGQAEGDSESHVLDAWNGAKAYSTKEKDKHLYDYIDLDKKTGKPTIEKFDSKAQHIDVLAYNIYPLKAFKSDSKTKHPYLFQLLEEYFEIAGDKRTEKMLKALEIIQFIENKMPLFEYIDPAINELYDQMVFLTKKERKKGLTLPLERVEKSCQINQDLQNLDLDSLRTHLKEKKPVMDAYTILHAIKASLKAGDINFLKEVVDAGVPIERNLAALHYDDDPAQGLQKLAARLTISNGTLDLNYLCKKAIKAAKN